MLPIASLTNSAHGPSPRKLQTATCVLLQAAKSSPQTNSASSASKSLKRARSGNSSNDSTEALRCKRRIDFQKLGYSLPKPQPQAVARRNERERNRVKLVNLGFATLREHVPDGGKNKKMSKVDTLKSAVDYIKYLQQVLDENDAVNAAFHTNTNRMSSSVSPHSTSMAGSPTPSYCSDSSYTEQLSPDEEDLLDFTSWFQ